LDWLRDVKPSDEVVAIAISGYADFVGVKKAYKHGASSYVTKPCAVEDLEKLIDGFPGPWKRPG
jgi:YesN/AraC family two-component response regulator